MFDSVSKHSDSAGKLLSEPSENTVTYSRSEADYENLSDKFLLKDKNFSRQYAHVYSSRLAELRPELEKVIVAKYGNGLPIRKLFELQPGEKCFVIGTLFKHMELRPNILKEVSEEHHVVCVPPSGRYSQDEDLLILEDELQRISLKCNIDVHSVVTGVIVGVRGKEPEDDRGRFHVEEYCCLGVTDQPPRPELESDQYLALVSGLEFGSGYDDPLAVQLMTDLLTGQLGDTGQQQEAARVVRVIVAGNSLSQHTQDKENLHKARYLTKKTTAGSVEAVKTFDDFLIQLAACVDVDVMAGEFDPANFTLPQQPLHRCMFPQASRYPTLHCVTNPYHCTIDGISIMGSSGQPIQDIWKFSKLDDHLEILQKTLEWRHMAPTAPDTLGCYPYTQDDPFILKDCPHIYFAANQPEFGSKSFTGSRGQEVTLITVPRFSTTRTVVLVNLRTMDCQPLTFETHMEQSSEESPVDK